MVTWSRSLGRGVVFDTVYILEFAFLQARACHVLLHLHQCRCLFSVGGICSCWVQSSVSFILDSLSIAILSSGVFQVRSALCFLSLYLDCGNVRCWLVPVGSGRIHVVFFSGSASICIFGMAMEPSRFPWHVVDYFQREWGMVGTDPVLISSCCVHCITFWRRR